MVVQTSRLSSSATHLRSQQTAAPPWNITKQHPGILYIVEVQWLSIIVVMVSKLGVVMCWRILNFSFYL